MPFSRIREVKHKEEKKSAFVGIQGQAVGRKGTRQGSTCVSPLTFKSSKQTAGPKFYDTQSLNHEQMCGMEEKPKVLGP